MVFRGPKIIGGTKYLIKVDAGVRRGSLCYRVYLSNCTPGDRGAYRVSFKMYVIYYL